MWFKNSNNLKTKQIPKRSSFWFSPSLPPPHTHTHTNPKLIDWNWLPRLSHWSQKQPKTDWLNSWVTEAKNNPKLIDWKVESLKPKTTQNLLIEKLSHWSQKQPKTIEKLSHWSQKQPKTIEKLSHWSQKQSSLDATFSSLTFSHEQYCP